MTNYSSRLDVIYFRHQESAGVTTVSYIVYPGVPVSTFGKNLEVVKLGCPPGNSYGTHYRVPKQVSRTNNQISVHLTFVAGCAHT